MAHSASTPARPRHHRPAARSILPQVIALALLLFLGTPTAPAAVSTDPALSVSVRRLNQQILVSWFASNTVSYQMEATSAFPAGEAWTNAGSIVTGTGSILTLTNPLSPQPASRTFFRVKRLPPAPASITATFNTATSNLTIIGTSLDDIITVDADPNSALRINGGTVPVTGGPATLTNTLSVDIFGGEGSDQITYGPAATQIPRARLFGEAGDDLLTGGTRDDELDGGPGSDALIGRSGNDRLSGGPDNDTITWNPGDGSDVIEGDGGVDRLVFNASNASEILDFSTSGARVRLTRNIGAISLDLAGLERIDATLFGGADLISVNALASTGLAELNLNLTATAGGTTGDAAADAITVFGGAGPDALLIAANPALNAIEASGPTLGPLVRILNSESNLDTFTVSSVGNDRIELQGSAGPDTLFAVATSTNVQVSASGYPLPVSISGFATVSLNGLAGNDSISCSGNLAPLVALTLDGGDDDDTLLGGNGNDLLLGGAGQDFLDGNAGNDQCFGGSGQDTFQWDPGDGSDVIEGEAGTDRLTFNASNASEILDFSATAPRVRLTRNIGAISLDLAGLERIDAQLLGGADLVSVNSLAGTGLAELNLNLAATVGGTTGDAAADAITVFGTPAADAFAVTAGTGAVTVSGLATTVNILRPELALDTLNLRGLAGLDTFTIGPGVPLLLPVTTTQD